jgi:hypothetical protein
MAGLPRSAGIRRDACSCLGLQTKQPAASRRCRGTPDVNRGLLCRRSESTNRPSLHAPWPYRARGTAPRYPPTRFRALAVFRRRPPQRVVRSSLPASENLHNSGPPGDANSTLTVPLSRPRHRRVSSDHRRRATMQAVLAPERHPILSSADWVNNAAFFSPAPG